MNLADLKRLANAFENSDWDEIHLVTDDVEIYLSTDPDGGPAGTTSAAAPVSAAPTPAAPAPAAPAAAPPRTAAPGGLPAAPAAPAATVAAPPEGHPVLSPSPGIFWRSPAPGAPPFVEVGQRVEPDTPICIVEVMKLMNRVPAGVAGTVVAVLVGNGEPVERDQPLVVVAEGS